MLESVLRLRIKHFTSWPTICGYYFTEILGTPLQRIGNQPPHVVYCSHPGCSEVKPAIVVADAADAAAAAAAAAAAVAAAADGG